MFICKCLDEQVNTAHVGQRVTAAQNVFHIYWTFHIYSPFSAAVRPASMSGIAQTVWQLGCG